MDERIIQAMETGETVVTATRRLARACRLAYAERRREAGDGCWDTPKVLPWDAWLKSLWEEAQLASDGAEVLLGNDQAAAVWRRVISASDIALMDVGSAVRGVEDAWRLMHAWRLELPDGAGYWGEDIAAFVDWSRSYRRECERRGWLPLTLLPDRLAAYFEEGVLTPPDAIRLAGFDEFTPQQENLLAAVETAGGRLERVPLPICEGRRQRVVCHDDEDELAKAAIWARECLESDPEAWIAVVVPALAMRRARLKRVFDDVLQPRALVEETQPRPAYNISLGRPLDGYPLVRAALRILELFADRIDTLELGALLRSPFVAGGEREASGRARLDARLRRRGEPVVRLSDVLYALSDGGDDAEASSLAPEFEAALRRFADFRREADGIYTPGGWAALFSRGLTLLGWPRGRSLDSEEYQQVRAWEDVLDRFAALDAVTGEMKRAEALSHLRRLAVDTIFQPRTPARRLQVMGPLEVLGQQFDHIWIAGLDDETWPPAPRPNPWLPASLQREYGLPHAGAAREREYTERMTGHLLAAAPDVVVSHARWDGDREKAASPMIEDVPPWQPDEAVVAHALRDAVAAADAQERIEDLTGPPLNRERAPGGAGALESQSACPMQAFGRYRLGARQLERPRLGIDARERGQLLHRTLEFFFERHDSLPALRTLDESGREAALRECAEAAVAESTRRRPHTFSERFAAVEVETLVTLALEWLAVEAKRPDFRVRGREAGAEVELAGANFRIKLDRIDELEDGRQLVIDYKSGSVSAKDWDGERPPKPQLPLYALTRPADELAGVAYANIRPGEARFLGCLASPALLPGVEPLEERDFQSHLTDWREALERLAGEFVAGRAEPEPLNKKICEYCDLHGLCRISEIRAERHAIDDDEVEA